MGSAELDETLRSSIRLPLLTAKKPARRPGEAEMGDYRRAVAEDVIRRAADML